MFLKRRLRRYRDYYRDQQLVQCAPQQTLAGLMSIWQQWRWEDIGATPDVTLMQYLLYITPPNIVSWQQEFHHHNRMIEKQQDQALETQFIRKGKQVRQGQSLDLFFTDNERYSVEPIQQLRRLHGELCIHQRWIQHWDENYYLRWSQPYYSELVQLTEALLESALRHHQLDPL